MRIIQALWPSILLTCYSASFVAQRDFALIPIIFVLLLWVILAFLLNPNRTWTWWTSMTPVALYTLAGLACMAGIVHMILFPNHSIWTGMNQPGAILLLGAFFFVIPGSLLLLHLFAVRRQFRKEQAA